MAVDPRIILGINPVQMQGPLDQYSKALALQNLMGQQDVQQLQIAEHRTKMADAASERSALAQFMSGPQTDEGIARVAATNPQTALKLRELVRKEALDKSKQTEQEVKTAAEQAKYLRDQMAQVGSQDDYTAFLAEAKRVGSKHADILPPTFDPAIKQRYIMDATHYITQNAPKPTAVNLGGTTKIVDLNKPGNVDLTHTPAPAAPTELARLIAERDKLPEGSPARTLYDLQIKKVSTHAPAPTANVFNVQEKEESKAVGKHFGEEFAKIQGAAVSAQGKIARFDRLDSLLKGIDTGKLTPLTSEAAQTLSSLGVKVDPKWSNVQAAEALASEMALELRNPSGGAGMPGALSDADRNYLKGMVPGVEKTPEGRRLIIETGKAMAKRDQEVARLARDYRKKAGTMDAGFYDELATYSEKNPVFAGKAPPADRTKLLNDADAILNGGRRGNR